MTGPSPVDRGKKGSKIHVLSEAEGIPLVVGVSAANTHDSTMLRPLVEGDLNDDPVTGLTMRIGERIAELLRASGLPDDRAATWGHGLVGCVRAATDQWIRAGMNRPATVVADDLCLLLASAYTAPRLANTVEGHQ